MEEFDIIKRHLDIAKVRASNAEKELKRIRVQLKELKEAYDQSLSEIAILNQVAEDAEEKSISAIERENMALSKAMLSDKMCNEAEDRERTAMERLGAVENKLSTLELEHAHEIKHLTQELNIARLQKDMDSAKQEIKELEENSSVFSLGNVKKLGGLYSSNSRTSSPQVSPSSGGEGTVSEFMETKTRGIIQRFLGATLNSSSRLDMKSLPSPQCTTGSAKPRIKF